MAVGFVRLDLSPNAHDFQSIATVPGYPMLDRYQTNFTILNKWLGDFVALPVTNGDGTVDFYAIQSMPEGPLCAWTSLASRPAKPT
jgi:hypothetical protein